MSGGIYFHYPYCIQKCHYCDFTSFATKNLRIDLISKAKEEILARSQDGFQNLTFDTIYFGGGTPSLMSSRELEQLHRVLLEDTNLIFSEHLECTIETNPETVTGEQAKQWMYFGFNRISMGAQSADNHVLSLSGRVHLAEKIQESFHVLRDSGFNNINLDFILGLPGETDVSIQKNLALIGRLNPEHLSIYFLTVNENSKLYDQLSGGELRLPLDENIVSRWGLCVQTLADIGYDHYEISNFSKPGYQCQHNLHYWHLDPYLGIGVSAVGFDGTVRYTNPKTLEGYEDFNFSKIPAKFKEKVTLTKWKREKIMLGFRLLREGVDQNLIQKNKKDILTQWIEKGFIVEKENRLHLTEQGVVFSNQVISSLF